MTKLPFKLPRRRYIKDRSVSDYTYSSHADGFDECLLEIQQLLDLHGITFDESERCTKESLGLAGVQEDD